MNLRTLLSVYGVLIGVGGLIFLIVPTQNLALYGVQDVGDVSITLSRYAGSMGIAVGVIAWTARAAGPSPARSGLVLGLIIANALSAAVCLLGALSGAFNQAAWFPTAAFAVFAALFVYVGRRNASQAQPAAARG